MNDSELLAGWQNRQREAFKTFYNACFASIKDYVVKIITDEAEAEEIVIDCFAKFWEKKNLRIPQHRASQKTS